MSSVLDQFISKSKNKKIVFTNGCFDILHTGHVMYLNQARSCGDLLVIGLNSDSSVKKLKGNSRPINPENDRKFILENLRSVDHVEIFHEDTPLNLIKYISPHVLVKGGDWKIEEIIGSDFVILNGGKVFSLDFKEGFSTTNTINQIHKLST